MKVWNYVFISTFLALLFEMAGIPVASNLLTYMGITVSSTGIKTSAMYLAIFGGSGILVGITTAVIIGAITRTPPVNYVILPFVLSGLTLFIGSFSGIILYAFANYPGWIASVITLIMSPLAVGFVIALIEFFRGTD